MNFRETIEIACNILETYNILFFLSFVKLAFSFLENVCYHFHYFIILIWFNHFLGCFVILIIVYQFKIVFSAYYHNCNFCKKKNNSLPEVSIIYDFLCKENVNQSAYFWFSWLFSCRSFAEFYSFPIFWLSKTCSNILISS